MCSMRAPVSLTRPGRLRYSGATTAALRRCSSVPQRRVIRCSAARLDEAPSRGTEAAGVPSQPVRPLEPAERTVLSDQALEPVLPARDSPDETKESSRKYHRSLSSFTWDRWASHRSTWRYVRHMRGIFKSSIVRGLQQPLLYVGGLSTLVCAYEQALQDGLLPGSMPSLQLSSIPFELSSVALSLLLVFRTNTSYDRWSNACSLWETVGNVSRDMLRQVLFGGLAVSGESSPVPAAVARWLSAYARSLKAQLTEDSDLRAELRGTMEPEEAELLCSSWHPPSFALAVLSELLGTHARAAGLRQGQSIRLDEGLSALEAAVGGCERIVHTPIPLSYTRHTSRFLVIWLTTLPLGLWPGCHWGTIPLALILAFLLLGIEEIGVQIEEPFGLLPLDDTCEEIEGDLNAMLREVGTAKAAAAAAAAAMASAAAGQGSRERPMSPGKAAVKQAASGLASNIASLGRKLKGAPVAGDGAVLRATGSAVVVGAGGSMDAHREWAEMGRRARRPGVSADAIFSSLDEADA